ncbi:hypothetical protein [Massilia sp. CF038]|uniref:hypothetical protein n=1 Tax=Massilia sp. CF038 TaxID=1881045 RepID=UPI00091797C5|nr:hypothetical protein [Massilia sp. CF038]SHH09983.1 hypothetical protein SAMN05428948_2766 [Massilia sp. CF038]
MDYTFSFNGRMLLMLGVVLALLMGLSFGLGMVVEQSRAVPAAPVLKQQAKGVAK